MNKDNYIYRPFLPKRAQRLDMNFSIYSIVLFSFFKFKINSLLYFNSNSFALNIAWNQALCDAPIFCGKSRVLNSIM